jgi:hypothetical protein
MELDGAAGDVGEARDGRRLAHGCTDGVGRGIGVPVPVEDRVGTDAEEPGDRVGGPAEEVLELEDLEALGGGVEGPFLARELVEASGEDGSGPGEGGGLELGLLGLCEGGGERVVHGPQLSQEDSCGEA